MVKSSWESFGNDVHTLGESVVTYVGKSISVRVKPRWVNGLAIDRQSLL